MGMTMRQRWVLLLLASSMCLSAFALVGCGSTESGAIAPEKFAPPPTEKDEASSSKG